LDDAAGGRVVWRGRAAARRVVTGHRQRRAVVAERHRVLQCGNHACGRGRRVGVGVGVVGRLGDARPQPVQTADRGRTRAAAAAAPPPPPPPPQTGGHRFTRIRATARPHPDTAGASARRRPQPPATGHRPEPAWLPATALRPEKKQF